MWPYGVVVPAPALDQHLGRPERAEHLAVQQLIPELAVEGVLWDLAMDAAGVGIFDWNLLTGELRWDDRLLDLFGKIRAS